MADRDAALSRACPKCGTPGGAEITHVCMMAGIPSHIPTPVGPACPLCRRTDGTHVLGCAVERYILDRGLKSV